jgi:hypothetical protein
MMPDYPKGPDERRSWLEPRDRHPVDVVRAGNLSDRFTGFTPGQSLAALLPGELQGAPHVGALRLRSDPTLGRPRANEVAFNVSQTTQHGQHETAGAGARVGPRLGERPELSSGVTDAFNDG